MDTFHGHRSVLDNTLTAQLSHLHMASNTSLTAACHVQEFSLPAILGVEILSLAASPVPNFSLSSTVTHDWTKSEFSSLDFCNVTVEYTHTGDDRITIHVLLPEQPRWNGRFQATGGGGWSAEQGSSIMIPAVDAGYATASTDAGVSTNFTSPASWALLRPGTVDLATFNTFGSEALHYMALIGKAVTSDYYGQAPSYSYWQGCSQGGRQGNMMAQRYPDDFDGILAIAPAINWGHLFGALYWPRQVQNDMQIFPAQCEVRAITAAAISACDALDGVLDGSISRPDLCDFDPISLAGQIFDCDGTPEAFTAAGVQLVQKICAGPRDSDGSFMWYGYEVGSDLTVLTDTSCNRDGNCVNRPNNLPYDWFRLSLAKDPNFNVSAMSLDDYSLYFRRGIQLYNSIIETADPDITTFRDRGSKLLSYHGLQDNFIPTKGSSDYFGRVRDVDPHVDDYFRLFLAPGVQHCLPGSGYYPTGVLDALVQWTERGIAPEHLRAVNISNVNPITGQLVGDRNATMQRGRPVCLYPRVEQYLGGDADLLSSYRYIPLLTQ